MNRRHLIKSAAILPFADLGATQEARTSLLVDGTVPVNVIVTSHLGSMAADHHRKSWMGKVFETRGEWYDVKEERRELPSHLADMPGSLFFHKTLYGEAAEEIDYLVGAFRREHITCIVRIKDDHELMMLTIAEHIGSQQVPTVFDTTWSSAQLQKFFPDEEALGKCLEPDSSFWP